MFDAPLDLSGARILVTNDDGINAPGLKVLETVARSLSSDVWVVAPEVEQSGAGPSLLAVVRGEAEAKTVGRAMEEALAHAGVSGAARSLEVDTRGAVSRPV